MNRRVRESGGSPHQICFKERFKQFVDGADTDLSQYRVNLGRLPEEIDSMRSRIKEELFDVLTAGERKNFDGDTALKRINEALKGDGVNRGSQSKTDGSPAGAK